MTDPKLVTIICMKWGKKYGAEYVNKLYAMVDRNITLPFQMVCFTDDGSGVNSNVIIKDLPPLDLPEGTPERGWNKLTTLQNDLGDLSGEALFLDLDVVMPYQRYFCSASSLASNRRTPPAPLRSVCRCDGVSPQAQLGPEAVHSMLPNFDNNQRSRHPRSSNFCSTSSGCRSVPCTEGNTTLGTTAADDHLLSAPLLLPPSVRVLLLCFSLSRWPWL